MQLTSRGRLRPLRGDGWEESRQFSQPDASLPALPALAAAAADMLSRPTVPAGASKHPALVPIEEIERRLASEGAARDHSFPAMPNTPPPPQAQQWATGTESAERREYRAASPATPPGVGGVGTRFLRMGCTVLWQFSQNLVESEFTIPRPFPFAVHGGTVAARVAGFKYCQVAEKRELSVKTRYSCSTSTPVLDFILAPRNGCPIAACRNRAKSLVERNEELARAC